MSLGLRVSLGSEPSEDLDVFYAFLPPWLAVAQVRNCSFMASMPATLMARTSVPSSIPGSSPKESGGIAGQTIDPVAG